jgi:cytochrome c oxidase subunit 2
MMSKAIIGKEMIGCALFLQGSMTHQYDLLFWSVIALCFFVASAIATALIYWAWHYHRRDPDELPPQIRMNVSAEATWIIVPAVVFLAIFFYGSRLYFDIERPPDNAEDVYVVAKQWMWKLEHAGGQREINTLHVPVGRAIRLNMISADVIHSFYVPVFRIKQDVLPGRYTTIWFRADIPGTYHLFCAEYCGTEHSHMIGWVYAMEPKDYQLWLEQGAAEGSLASTGEKYFHQFGCANCHHFTGHGPGPSLVGLFGRPVQTEEGKVVLADESYIRNKILNPSAKVPQGFKSTVMPTFKGQLNEDEITALIAYIKAIGPRQGNELPSGPGEEMGDYQGVEPDLGEPVTPPNKTAKPGGVQ